MKEVLLYITFFLGIGCIIAYWFLYDGTFFRGQKPISNNPFDLILLIIGVGLCFFSLIKALKSTK